MNKSSSSLQQLWFGILLLYSFVFIALFHANAVGQRADEWGEKRCQLPLNHGNCTKKETRFYYDSAKMRCSKFIYTGCNGNPNRFPTRNLCKRKCHPYFRMSAFFQSDKTSENNLRQENDCGKNCANAGGVCVNGVCHCKDGDEKRDGKCIARNACDFISCETNAKCVNLPGSFRCKCLRGFAGSGFNCTKDRRICAQPFDARYEHQCQPEQRWVPRFYFHLASAQCRRFWYGGCQFGNSQNFFPNQKSCESFCGGYSRAEQFTDIALHTARQSAQQQQQRKLNDLFCLDPFDEIHRQPCAGGIWERRYYFAATIGRCRQFWMDTSCPSRRTGGSRSRNIFVHAQICRRLCEGKEESGRDEGESQDDSWVEAWSTSRNKTAGFIQASFARSTSTTTTSSTKTTTDSAFVQLPELAHECAFVRLTDQLALAKTAQEKRERLSRLRAKLDKSQRKGDGQRKQQQLWHNIATKNGKSEACLDRFDWNLTKSCGRIRWRTRFFYDMRLGKCRPFWHDGCPGRTRNNFREENTCRRKCELKEAESDRRGIGTLLQGSAQETRAVIEELSSPLSPSAICAHPFDQIYRRACNNGKSWTRRWYFDPANGFCRHFWYDGCVGTSRNIFEGLKQCMDMCVNENDFLLLDHSMRTENRQKFAYFESAQTTLLVAPKNYLKSVQIWLNEKQCAGFRYTLAGNALLSAFLCLLEEGGGCQRTVHRATVGGEQCHFGRPWLKGRHSYAWFFTLEKGRQLSSSDGGTSADNPTLMAFPTTSTPLTTTDDAEHSETEATPKVTPTDKAAAELLELPVEPQHIVRTASAVLTLRQPQVNSTESLVVPIELFGRHNETVATVELSIAPIDQCSANTTC